jgi:cytochrome c peroxidase
MIVVVACRKDKHEGVVAPFEPTTPKGFPVMQFPSENPYSFESWELGKYLFYDNRLSLNNDVSCASCHHQHLGFADNNQFSFGDNGAIGTLNSPTLTNVGYNPYFLFAGGVPTLEMQVLVPIQEHNEFNTNILDIITKLSGDEFYEGLSQKAYNRSFDAFVLTRAIANFQRTLVSGNSRFDQFYYQSKPVLSESELRGYELFIGNKANCITCHSGFNFTNYAFENNGLYEEYEHMGRMLLTFEESDRAKFKVPTLRNVAITAPYMHDGSIQTLSAVIEHYNSGGANHPNKHPLIQPLNLTQQEKQDLLNFLNSLTDYSFLTNPAFAKPE